MQDTGNNVQVKVCELISEICAQDWNNLVVDNNPFVRHEFLAALENQGCLGENFGWLPRHIAVYEQEQLIGLVLRLGCDFFSFLVRLFWRQPWLSHILQ